ncbi:uncharacterized protein DS421_11g340330 [Arachis hypogaea]|nr:uncharacterized protein DS421_11g340330 [Arachis hypogaea]
MLLLLDGLCDNLRSYSVLRRSSSVTSPPGSPSATSPKAAISSGDVSSSFLSLSSSVSSPPKSSTPNSSATIQAVCEDSSRVEKSVPQFALLTTFLHNLCSAALAAPPPPPPFLHSSASCLCRRPSLFQRLC